MSSSVSCGFYNRTGDGVSFESWRRAGTIQGYDWKQQFDHFEYTTKDEPLDSRRGRVRRTFPRPRDANSWCGNNAMALKMSTGVAMVFRFGRKNRKAIYQANPNAG
jgi:hypothetical protein